MSLFQICFLILLEGIWYGWLLLIMFEGYCYSFGGNGFEVQIYIIDWVMLFVLVWCGDVGFGESYIVGYWDSFDFEVFLLLVI